AYSAPVPHTGGEPVTFVVTSGALPPGLTLSPSGQITGTPTTGGAFPFTITASNAVSSAARAYTITIGKAATSTAVTSSANPSTVGGPVRFTAPVSGPAGTSPDGTVQFIVDGRPLGAPVAVVGGSATSGPVSTLALGSHPVTANYSGSGSFLPSSGLITQL